ncbi:InlB B-repeat-containing protein [Sanguibacter gelidistatuariae]|nr:InlB B-repeat-containing protein [Sanguibacter gelidistatuariae]
MLLTRLPSRLPGRADRRSCLVAAVLATVLGLAGALTAVALPASAAGVTTVATFLDLEDAIAAGGTVQLGADIVGTGLVVTRGKNVTLDLGGYELTVIGIGENGHPNGQAGIEVEAGASFTLDGSGTLRASGASGCAGIGGCESGMGTVVINSGTVIATGGQWGAGIGTGSDAGVSAEPGSVTINDGTVTATGSSTGGAGIGGGVYAVVPVLTINGGSVTAEGGTQAAGIGSGWGAVGLLGSISILGGVVNAHGEGVCAPGIGTSGLSAGGACSWGMPTGITIHDPATVTAWTSNSRGVSETAVRFATYGGGGSFDNSGTLIIPSGSALDVSYGGSVRNTGTIRGAISGEVTGNNFLLSFDSTGGTGAPSAVRVYAPTLAAAGMPVPAAPTRAGATFTGWSSSPLPGAGSMLTTTTQLSTATWYASWQGTSHAVNFVTDGGSTIEPVSVLEGATFTLPTAPTRYGSIFAGWYMGPTSGVLWKTTTPIMGPTTLYAHWIANIYTVVFDTGALGSPVSAQTVLHGSHATSPGIPAREGHSFAGWYTAATGGTPWNVGVAIVDHATVYAHWTADDYNIEFNSAGGTQVDGVVVAYGQPLTEPADPVLDGHSLVGWFAAGSATAWDFAAGKVTGPTVLTARWTLDSYAVTFDSAGGGTVGSQTIEHGAPLDEPEAPTRTGYEFVGWFAPGSVTAWNFVSDTVVGSVALTAHWSELTAVSVSLTPNVVSVVSGAAVTVTGTLAPAGATGTIEFFDGTTSLGSGTVSAGVFSLTTTTIGVGDRLLTAVFTPADTLFAGSTSDPVGVRVNVKAAQGAAPAATTDDLLDLAGRNGWPVRPDGARTPWSAARDSFVDAFVYSTPVALGVLPVVNGVVQRGALVLPALAPGIHHLVFVGQTTGTVTVIEFVVPEPTPGSSPSPSPSPTPSPTPGAPPSGTPTPSPTPPAAATPSAAPAVDTAVRAAATQPDADGLATTGAGSVPALVLAGIMMLLGVLLVAARSRRRLAAK